MVAFQRYVSILTLRTYEYDLNWKRHLCRYNQVKDLKMRTLWTIQVVLKSSDSCPYRKHTEERCTGKRGKGCVNMEIEVKAMQPQTKGSVATGIWKRQRSFSPRTLRREHSPTYILTSDF